PLACRHPHVMRALRADVQVRLEVGRVQHRVARWALDPYAFGDLLAPRGRTFDARRKQLVEPGHEVIPDSWAAAAASSIAARIDAMNCRARCGACCAGPSRTISIVRVPMITASAAPATTRAVAASR